MVFNVHLIDKWDNGQLPYLAVVILVLLEKPLSIVVGVYVDLGDSVVGCGLDGAFVHAGLEPGEGQLQPGIISC